MTTALVGLILFTAAGIVTFGLASMVDEMRRRREQRAFLTQSLRMAVIHTASKPVRRALPARRTLPSLPALPAPTWAALPSLEDSGVYQMQ